MAKNTKSKDDRNADGSSPPGFEQSLERLEEIVAELEGEDVPLEHALALFEEGVKLGRACSSRLDEAERKITMLLEQADGALVEKAYDAAAGEGEAAAPRRAPSRGRGAPKPAPAGDDADDDGDDGIPF